MINKIILKHIIKKKIYNKNFLIAISLAMLLCIILSALSGDISSIIAGIVLVLLITISMIWTEYDILNYSENVPTPLNIIMQKQNNIIERHDEITFLGINPEERLALKGIIKEYDEAIDLLKGKNEN